MLKPISTAIVTAVLIGSGVVAAIPASADTRPCMSRTEYRAVKNGMSVNRVASIVGSRGRISMNISATPYSPSMITRDYKLCGQSSGITASVMFTGGRVSHKMAFWL